MLKTATFFTFLLASATGAFAQSTKPGLWEIQHKMGGNPQMDQAMAQMQKQLAGMSPAQRKQMEAMMGKQGMAMPAAAAGGGMTTKICISPEMAARSEMPSQNEGDCTTTVTARSGNSLKMSYVCKNPPSTGEGTYTFSGDTAYTMKMVMNTTRQGKPETMTMDGKGKWLSSDCGAIKPIKAPGK
jgi:hypothetical protein